MPWPKWADYRRFADFRLGIKQGEEGDEYE